MKNWTLKDTRTGNSRDYVTIVVSLNGSATVSEVKSGLTEAPNMHNDDDIIVTHTGIAGRPVEIWENDELGTVEMLSLAHHKAVAAAYEEIRS